MNDFNTFIQQVYNEKIHSLYRVLDMICVDVGEDIPRKNFKGQDEMASMYAFHMQCPWRLLRTDGSIYTASYDVYVSEDDDEDNDGDDDHKRYLFDEKAEQWMAENKYVRISQIELTERGDLLLLLTNGECMQAFVNTSSDIECWRFLKRDTEGPHLIATGEGLSY